MIIRSIDDLEKYTPEEVEDIRSTISLKSHYFRGSSIAGKRETLTLDEYKEWAESLGEECPKCEGTGVFKKEVRSVGTIHASGSNFCVRKLYYDVVADRSSKSTISHPLQITFAIGHALHDHIQKCLSLSLGDAFQDEVRVDLPSAFVENSHTDGVADLGNTRVLLEVKSMGKEFERLTAPKEDHIVQAMAIYATAMDTPFIVFLYVSKSWPHDIKEYVLTYDHREYKKWWRRKGSKVEKALLDGTPPIADAKKAECDNCGYNYFCEQRAR